MAVASHPLEDVTVCLGAWLGRNELRGSRAECSDLSLAYRLLCGAHTLQSSSKYREREGESCSVPYGAEVRCD